MLGAEGLHILEVARDECRRHQVEEIQNPDLLRRVADVPGIVDHQRLGVDALQQVRRCDVGHVERRVLAQQHDVPFCQVFDARL